jgi:cytoskeletal protein RodZ
MRTKRRRAAVGAISATLLVFAATACGAESGDSTAESTSDSAVESTVGDTEAPNTDAPSTDAPIETTAPTSETAEPETGSDDPTSTDTAVVVPEALQFTAPLVGGGTFDGAAAAGKPTVFWFWAPT